MAPEMWPAMLMMTSSVPGASSDTSQLRPNLPRRGGGQADQADVGCGPFKRGPPAPQDPGHIPRIHHRWTRLYGTAALRLGHELS